jgi:predicted RNase H-like HicB family nuclease
MAHGKGYDEALFNIKEAIKRWIETAKKFGDSIPRLRVD